MANVNGIDTNEQSGRADLRKQGYFIDDSGVYAPGGGSRVGDTWSGGNSGHNAPDNGNRLPVIGGTPVSPSNGFTGPNTGAIMYRSDPLYQSFFGPGTPGYSSAPTPWAPGQAASWNGMDPMNYLGQNFGAPGFQEGMASAATQTPFADYLKANGGSMVGLPGFTPQRSDSVTDVATKKKTGASPYNADGLRNGR